MLRKIKTLAILCSGVAGCLGVWSFAHGQGYFFARGSTGAFSPLDRGANLVAWYKADAGVYEDAGTDEAEDEDAVQQWNDQSGNGKHITQGTAGNRPLFQTGIQNALPGVQFVSSDYLLSSSAVVTAAPFTAYLVARTGTTASYQAVASFCASGANQYFEGEFTSGGTALAYEVRDGGGDAPVNTTTGYSIDTVYIITIQEIASNNRKVWKNGASGGTDTTSRTPSGVDQLAVGMRRTSSPSFPLTGYVMEIVVTDQADDASQRSQMESYLTTKWGL